MPCRLETGVLITTWKLKRCKPWSERTKTQRPWEARSPLDSRLDHIWVYWHHSWASINWSAQGCWYRVAVDGWCKAWRLILTNMQTQKVLLMTKPINQIGIESTVHTKMDLNSSPFSSKMPAWRCALNAFSIYWVTCRSVFSCAHKT